MGEIVKLGRRSNSSLKPECESDGTLSSVMHTLLDAGAL